jgi:hypothetical protein
LFQEGPAQPKRSLEKQASSSRVVWRQEQQGNWEMVRPQGFIGHHGFNSCYLDLLSQVHQLNLALIHKHLFVLHAHQGRAEGEINFFPATGLASQIRSSSRSHLESIPSCLLVDLCHMLWVDIEKHLDFWCFFPILHVGQCQTSGCLCDMM